MTTQEQMMIDAFVSGVICERLNGGIGVMIDCNYTDDPEEMARAWLNEKLDDDIEEYYYTEGDLSEKTARRNHRIKNGNDDFR